MRHYWKLTLTEAGNIDLIDNCGEESNLGDRMDVSLPGVQRGDLPSVGTSGILTQSVSGFL